jgi:hypothetical protein
MASFQQIYDDQIKKLRDDAEMKYYALNEEIAVQRERIGQLQVALAALQNAQVPELRLDLATVRRWVAELQAELARVSEDTLKRDLEKDARRGGS